MNVPADARSSLTEKLPIKRQGGGFRADFFTPPADVCERFPTFQCSESARRFAYGQTSEGNLEPLVLAQQLLHRIAPAVCLSLAINKSVHGGFIMISMATRTLGELAVEISGATRVFEHLGIDYCCGGTRSLAQACAAAGIPLDNVKNSLELAMVSEGQSAVPDFRTTTLTELISYIVEKHHRFTKSEIARLPALMDKVIGVHGRNHPELCTIRSLFKSLSSELEPHMMKEERVLFPFIMQMEQTVNEKTVTAKPAFGTVRNPIQMMMLEHEGAGYLLKHMRMASSDYAIPSEACISYQTLYQALDAFEADLHHHIHLENNILFPRALEMETEAS